ncbi:MAG: circadian clock KaiB family protein [Syntrophales bacterium LBB04]|nr:circadian clock KaiB family protein [Syntrophales bacterium LBB04]
MKSNPKQKPAKASTLKAKENIILDWEKKPDERYVLRLYVTGMTPNSVRAMENTKAICEEYLKGYYELEIIDIFKQPSLAKGEQILAAPTLVKRLPLPLRRLVGDLSQKDRVLLGLDLIPKK